MKTTAEPEAPQTFQLRDEPVRQYAPGVVLDWKRRRVVVDARVALSRGPLEFLVCSPKTKEHESLFVSPARPLHMFEAMGLLGLEPGAPPTFDGESLQWRSAHGALVQIQIQYLQDEIEYTIPPERWLEGKGGKPVPSVRWLFCGSRRLPDGRFGADVEGGVIALVNFENSLISVAESHSASDAELWVSVGTQALPRGTECRIIVSAAPSVPEQSCIITKSGQFRILDGDATAAELARRFRIPGKAANLVFDMEVGVSRDGILNAIARLKESGFEAEEIVLRPSADDSTRSQKKREPFEE